MAEGAEVVAIIRQETPERCAAGLRSRDAIDVAAIAASFGGDHKNAASLAVPGTIASPAPSSSLPSRRSSGSSGK
jgi:phosphoesterase RecJ-like protein